MGYANIGNVYVLCTCRCITSSSSSFLMNIMELGLGLKEAMAYFGGFFLHIIVGH